MVRPTEATEADRNAALVTALVHCIDRAAPDGRAAVVVLPSVEWMEDEELGSNHEINKPPSWFNIVDQTFTLQVGARPHFTCMTRMPPWVLLNVRTDTATAPWHRATEKNTKGR